MINAPDGLATEELVASAEVRLVAEPACAGILASTGLILALKLAFLRLTNCVEDAAKVVLDILDTNGLYKIQDTLSVPKSVP